MGAECRRVSYSPLFPEQSIKLQLELACLGVTEEGTEATEPGGVGVVGRTKTNKVGCGSWGRWGGCRVATVGPSPDGTTLINASRTL